MFEWLRNYFTNEHIADMMAEMDEFYDRISEVEGKQAAFQAEIWDYIGQTLEPLKKRISTRMYKEEQKDLSTPSSKGGMMRGNSGLIK